jgi:copper(I)-binding protein
VAATAVLVLASGCGGGQTSSAQATASALSTNRQHAQGADATAASLAVLSATVAAPPSYGATYGPGQSVALLLTVANHGTSADELTGATSPVAAQVVYRDGQGAPTAQLQVQVPPGGVAELRQTTGPHLELTGLTQSLHSGQGVPVTFQFTSAGPLTVSVPVDTYQGGKPTSTASPTS